jgi:hypothetical protein
VGLGIALEQPRGVGDAVERVGWKRGVSDRVEWEAGAAASKMSVRWGAVVYPALPGGASQLKNA